MENLNGQRVNGILAIRNADNTLSVSVSVEPLQDKDPEVRITAKDIIQYLSEKNIQYIECIQSAVVTNTSEARFGTWIFSVLPREEPKSIMEIMSDDIVREIDQEVLADLLKTATPTEPELDMETEIDVVSEKPKRGRKAKKDTDNA